MHTLAKILLLCAPALLGPASSLSQAGDFRLANGSHLGSSPLVLPATPFSPACSSSVLPSQEPLPAVDSVMAKVLEHARKGGEEDRQFQAHYTYKRHKITEERNPKGKLEKRHERVSRHNPPTRSAATKVSNPKPQNQSKSSGTKRPFDQSDFPLDKELLEHFQFTIRGREIINERSTLLVDFQPAERNFPIRSLKDHFLSKVAGCLWIDEIDYALVQTDLHLIQSVSIVGGIIGCVKKLAYRFDRERTDDGLWFTRRVKWQVEFREFLVSKILSYAEEALEVKKVN